MWVYQAVTNVGVQVLMLMALGYVFARFRILEQAKFLPISNFIVLMLALPAFNIYLMGIKLDLQKPEPWKSLAAFLVWVFAVQGSILLYVWRFCGGDAGEAAVINMVLLMDNYAITGLLALNATLGTKWGPLALLMAMGFFLVIFPFSLAAFEWEKWAVQQHLEATAAAAVYDIEAAAATAAAVEEAEQADGEAGPGGPGAGGADGTRPGAVPAAVAPPQPQTPPAPAAEEGEGLRAGKHLPAPSGDSSERLLLGGPRSAEIGGSAGGRGMLARAAAAPAAANDAAAGGGFTAGVDADGYEVSLYGFPERGDIGPPPAGASTEPPLPPPPTAGTVAAPPSAATTTGTSPATSALKGPAGGSGGGGVAGVQLQPPQSARGEGSQAEGFPHEDRYCWWSNAEYRPAHPLLLDVGTAPSAAAHAAGGYPATIESPLAPPPPLQLQPQPSPERSPAKQGWPWRKPTLPQRLTQPLAPQQQAPPQSQPAQPDRSLRGTYVPPAPVPHSHDAAEQLLALSRGPAAMGGLGGGAASSPASPRAYGAAPGGVSPFQSAAAAGQGWPPPAASPRAAAAAGPLGAGAGAGTGGASPRVRGTFTASPSSQPVTAPSSARRRTVTTTVGPGGLGVFPSPERHPSFLLPVLFERLAEAGSGQLPPALFGDLMGQQQQQQQQQQQGAEASGVYAGSRPTSGMLGQESVERPLGLQDLEFALTHQITGGTASQLARVSRGYSAAAAAAAAAATSGDPAMRRLLLAATNAANAAAAAGAAPPLPNALGGGGGPLPALQEVSGTMERASEWSDAGWAQPGAQGTAGTAAVGATRPGQQPRRPSRMQPPPAPSPFAAAATAAGDVRSVPYARAPLSGSPATPAGGGAGAAAAAARHTVVSAPGMAPAMSLPAPTPPSLSLGVAGPGAAAAGLHRGDEASAPPTWPSSFESYNSYTPPPANLPPPSPRLTRASAYPVLSPRLTLPTSTSATATGSPQWPPPSPPAVSPRYRPPAPLPLPPPPITTEAADSATQLLPPCPTFTARQGAPPSIGPGTPWLSDMPAHPEGHEGYRGHEDGQQEEEGGRRSGLATMSSPMFSFGRSPAAVRSIEMAAAGAAGDGRGGDGGGVFGAAGGALRTRSARQPQGRKLSYVGGGPRSAEAQRADRALLALASGLALSGSKARGVRRAGDTTPGFRGLLDADGAGGNVFMRLATAASALEPLALEGGEAAAAEADRRLVREATAEMVRKHGGVAGAFAAFVSGHPQLWHIVRTLAKNPMIWTMFIAMAMSVSGLRVFLDPASPRYRPEVGWVAGTLAWINGLVVPMSIFSNGAWMYGKPLLPQGEAIKMIVLMAIKVGLMPLLMAGCAILVQLDSQHVAAMTVLTLSPAAAASFVLAVQYGRGVELVSLTNILGNVFLTPLLIMWLKVLSALNIDYKLHDDT